MHDILFASKNVVFVMFFVNDSGSRFIQCRLLTTGEGVPAGNHIEGVPGGSKK